MRMSAAAFVRTAAIRGGIEKGVEQIIIGAGRRAGEEQRARGEQEESGGFHARNIGRHCNENIWAAARNC